MNPLERLVEAAAKGVTSAILDKVDEVMTRDVKADDAKTDPGLLRRIRDNLSKLKPK
jgi:hypothetical protein